MGIRKSWLLLAALMLSGCQQNLASQPESPALLTELNAEIKHEIEQAMLQVVGGTELRLADTLFQTESAVFIERAPVYSPSGQLVSPRQQEPSYRFELLLQGDRCFLSHPNSGRRFELTQASCRAAEH